jgi:hypothetical protein
MSLWVTLLVLLATTALLARGVAAWVLRRADALRSRVRQFEGQVVDFYGAHVKTLHYRLV